MTELFTAINKLLAEKEQVIVALDGRCAAGKTTLAKTLKNEFLCNVFHMDDFFLRPEQRTAERLDSPGGNVDSERFLAEILLPLKCGGGFSYRPYSCKSGALGDAIQVEPNRLNVVEGSYSCHPLLCEHYDLSVFLDIAPQEQLRRIEKRNGVEAAKKFQELWIPFEEKYFDAFGIASACDFLICV